MKRFPKFLLIAGLLGTLAACDDDSNPFGVGSQGGDDVSREENSNFESAPMTIVDIVIDQANNEGEFNELLNAVLAADPVVLETLSGPGQFTVFAPTDDAFEALEKTGAFNDVDQEDLTDILLYHVAEGGESASEVLAKSFLPMLNGNIAKIDAVLGMIDEATIVATDIRADNGIIHVIDAVLLPEGR
jgi:uncharacterized surface protein with fasciclin (FAS1) repeats